MSDTSNGTSSLLRNIPSISTDSRRVNLRADTWLAAIVGMPCFQVTHSDESDVVDLRKNILGEADGGSAFFFAKIPTGNARLATSMTQAGFCVTDVNVMLDWTAKGDPGALPESDRISVGPASAEEIPGIEEIAGTCFTHSRFHLDPLIPVRVADEVKRQWAGNACRGRAAVVYAAHCAERLAGFLAVMTSGNENRGKDAILDLIGVDAAYQGQGVGRSLTRVFIDEWRYRADRLRVGTQVSNIPALRLYESLGFRISETSYVLHAHIRDGVICV